MNNMTEIGKRAERFGAKKTLETFTGLALSGRVVRSLTACVPPGQILKVEFFTRGKRLTLTNPRSSPAAPGRERLSRGGPPR
jgi:hypothetical protein